MLAITGLHLIVLGLMSTLGVWRDRGPAATSPPPLLLRLLDSERHEPRAAARPAPQPPRAQRPARPADPQTITLPPADSTPPNPAAEPQAAPAVQGPTPSPPLNLTLPRGASAPWRAANPALEALPRASLESRLAAALGGDGTWVEERIDNDRIRFRRGDTCVDVERSRVEQLNPFNSSFSPKPWVAKQPGPCSAR